MNFFIQSNNPDIQSDLGKIRTFIGMSSSTTNYDGAVNTFINTNVFCNNNQQFCEEIVEYMQGDFITTIGLVVDDQIVGLISFKFLGSEFKEDPISILKMVTTPGEGYGRELVQKVEAIAHFFMIQEIQLQTTETSKDFWEHMEYADTGEMFVKQIGALSSSSSDSESSSSSSESGSSSSSSDSNRRQSSSSSSDSDSDS